MNFQVGDQVVVEPGGWRQERQAARCMVVKSVGTKWVRVVGDPHGQWSRITGQHRDYDCGRIWTLDDWADIRARRALLVAIRQRPAFFAIRSDSVCSGDIGVDLATLRRVAQALGVDPDAIIEAGQ